ncbi:hypothetical protein OIU84_015922 [Salix udensis]|uniref:Uncharacterized protein n=1 Tax=Salix udensis TaxID=889485 RepID=A0AAD6J8B9_9ROSI|nr:hypothetical protein OIU84_015922 [Salix udensis]
MQFQFLKWPMWLLGPSLLLATGMVPTLWLPLSSVFLGPNIASLLSLIGLDCIFNLGATLFLLMADSCSRPQNQAQTCNSKPPLSYKFWNMVATISGFVIPLMMLLGSQKGILQPQLPLYPICSSAGSLHAASICTDSDRVADLALAVTSMAGNPSCVRVLSAATADEGIEAWGRAQCSNMDVAYDQGAGILVDSNPWCSAHECCLVCRFRCSISAAPLFCCFWWLAPFTVTEDSTKSRGFKYGFGSIHDQIIPGIIAPFSSLFTVNVCSYL